MIAKEDIKIGNLVIFKNEICEVTIISKNGSIGVTDKHDATTIVQGKDLDPITLDKTSLAKLGFTVVNGKFDSFSCEVKKYDAYSVFVSNCIGWNGLYVSIYNEQMHNIRNQGIGVKYVHELQNVIRFCTHQDLEVHPVDTKKI